MLAKQKRKATASCTPKKEATEKGEKDKISESSSKVGGKRKFGPCHHYKKGHTAKFY